MRYCYIRCIEVTIRVLWRRVCADHPGERTRRTTDDNQRHVRHSAAAAAVLRGLQFTHSHVRHQGRTRQLQYDRLSISTRLGHEISRDLAQVCVFVIAATRLMHNTMMFNTISTPLTKGWLWSHIFRPALFSLSSHLFRNDFVMMTAPQTLSEHYCCGCYCCCYCCYSFQSPFSGV